MIVIFQFLLDFVIAMVELHFPSFFRWRASGFGYSSTYLLYFAVNLLTAAYFARTDSPRNFLERIRS